MTGVFSVVWRIEPAHPPRPWRHCSACGTNRPFRSSGKVRLNANGQRLDAWLIYKCEVCDRSWTLPLLERTPVASISAMDFQAMHGSDPAWVRAREFDLATLRRHCGRIDLSPDLTVVKIVEGDRPHTWSVVALSILAPRRSGQRLDRLLAHELAIPRSEVQSMHEARGLDVWPASGKGLRRPVSGSLTLRFIAPGLTDRQRAILPGRLSGDDRRGLR